MLLKSIKLENFRQFRNESIDFAQGEDGRNVTIIIGENGTGKTTFSQAFFWCLYGETDFSDKIMINKVVADKMMPNDIEKVMVKLELRHGEVLYTLIREQEYKKDYSNKVKGSNTILNIAIKDKDGNTSYVRNSMHESEVRKILPKELARYFFFDGERIEGMSKDISSGKKVEDFAEAVQGLLGLNAIITAIKHFNPRSKYGVIGSYESSFDSASNEKIQVYTNKINDIRDEIDRLDIRLEEIDGLISIAEKRKMDKTIEIRKYSEGERFQDEKERLLKCIENAKKSKTIVYRSISDTFNENLDSFFTKSLIYRALIIIAQADLSGKDIPYMHGKTIDYLLEKKVCLCGTDLIEDSIPYNKVKELKSFLPPQSISTTIRDFKKESRKRCKDSKDLKVAIKEKLATISEQEDDIMEWSNDLNEIEEKLKGNNVKEKVRKINNEIKLCVEAIEKDSLERDNIIKKIERLKGEVERTDSERGKIVLLDEKNKKIEIYKAYAECIYDELQSIYNDSETKIRERLQDTINEIFLKLYDGGLYLTIDSKYHISVGVTDYEGDVETSTAQSIAVIFAFITSIIQMASENRNSSDEDSKLLSSEPYPLVMDAPLSAFDKRRIKSVCDTIPEIADQVIIFIKDLDGELAEKYMADRIGSRHYFEKKNEFETVLV